MAKAAREEPTRFEAWRGHGGKSAGAARREEEDIEVPDGEEEGVLDGKVIGLRLSRKDLKRFASEAESEGVTLTEYLREVLSNVEDDPDLERKRCLRELATAQKHLSDYAKLPANKGKKAVKLAEHAEAAIEAFCEQLQNKPEEKGGGW
jgi:hypothetical protein